jgi:hypothetical protein
MKFWTQRTSAKVPVEIETCSEWTAACEVQQRFPQYLEPAIEHPQLQRTVPAGARAGRGCV